MNVYRSNTHRKGQEPRVPHTCSSSLFNIYPSSNKEHQLMHDSSIPCKKKFHDIKSNLRRKKLHRTVQGYDFFEGTFNNTMHEPKFRSETEKELTYSWLIEMQGCS